MKIIYAIIMLIFSFNLSAISGQFDTVVIVSIDALHPAAVTEVNCPNIFKYIKNGLYISEGKSTTPPKTLVAHTSMVTGLTPEQNGKIDNVWKKGDKKVEKPTVFLSAKKAGYKTAFIYSKPKLGYLADSYVDYEKYSRDNAIEEAVKFLGTSEKQFVFLHISGLDIVGPESGWMSKEYIEEFNFIDEMLGYLFKKLDSGNSYLLVITSDHAGHDKIHGSNHKEDFKRPIIIYSSKEKITNLNYDVRPIENLKIVVEDLYLK
ncbi:alkaline phosphatase family protein [Deferribacteraceae bacterium V6Fe1]|nr:alkaline phosphatase family protein [Deferribacteraceae bacterium V6Fe1]